MNTQITYHVSKEYQNKILVETGDMPSVEVKTSLDLVSLPPEDRKEVAVAMDTWLGWPWFRLTNRGVDSYGDISIDYSNERLYDHLLTPGEIVEEIKILNRQITELLPLSGQKKALLKAERERAAKEKAEYAIKHEAAEAERLVREEAVQEKRKAERATWIGEHGSERLKLCLAGDYPLTGLYLEERVAIELGEGWEVDTKDQAETEEKASPRLEALLAVKALPEGYTGEVVWLTTPPSRVDACSFEPCEAVKVSATYTNHDIFKLMDC